MRKISKHERRAIRARYGTRALGLLYVTRAFGVPTFIRHSAARSLGRAMVAGYRMAGAR